MTDRPRPETMTDVLTPDVFERFLRPFGSMIFRARLAGLAFKSQSIARQEHWGNDDTGQESRRIRRQNELFQQGRRRLVEKTLDSGFGSERFMAKLRAEAGELDGAAYPAAPATSELPPKPSGYKVPDYPDFSEQALFDDQS